MHTWGSGSKNPTAEFWKATDKDDQHAQRTPKEPWRAMAMARIGPFTTAVEVMAPRGPCIPLLGGVLQANSHAAAPTCPLQPCTSTASHRLHPPPCSLLVTPACSFHNTWRPPWYCTGYCMPPGTPVHYLPMMIGFSAGQLP